jgi:hypothetical protein
VNHHKVRSPEVIDFIWSLLWKVRLKTVLASVKEKEANEGQERRMFAVANWKIFWNPKGVQVFGFSHVLSQRTSQLSYTTLCFLPPVPQGRGLEECVKMSGTLKIHVQPTPDAKEGSKRRARRAMSVGKAFPFPLSLLLLMSSS